MIARIGWLFLPALMPAYLGAADIRSIQMLHEDGRYTVHAETFLTAAPQLVYSVLLDYDNFSRLSESITESRWLDDTSNHLPLAYTRIDSCVAFFCRKLEKVETVELIGEREIRTAALPGRSDFRYHRARWRVAAAEGGSIIYYELEMEPDFWVPPLVGPWAIKRKASQSALKIAERLEYMSRNGIALEAFDLNAYQERK